MFSFSPFSFPVWWYGEGLELSWGHTKAGLRYVLRSVGLLIFLRNMAEPLYGDYTRSGRAISFVIRLVLLVVFFIWTVIRMSLVLLGFFLHLAILPLTVVMIIYQLFPI